MSFGVLCIAPALPEFLGLYPEVSNDLRLTDAHVDLVSERYGGGNPIAFLIRR
jgi:DNA-binding transcriptional LysR family regulator